MATTTANNKRALLLLAHQGRSYLPMIMQALGKFGVACLVLSSKPLDPCELDNLRTCQPAELWDVKDDYLDESHVASAIEQAQALGYEIVGALATFEGYRALMAETNLHLNATDANPAAITHSMDKYLCRKTLAQNGLSGSVAEIVDANNIDALRNSGRKLFIKPRRGAGSFACFALDDTFTADKLHELQRQMRDDVAFRAIFSGQFDFIAEDCIHGDEYSFEVLVSAGESYVIGVHAKYLDDSSGTTLETSNSCPAPRLSDAHQLEGERYVDRCLAALDLREGCYHIEARHNAADGRWDIIEINTRMGGALINESIGVFTGGVSILELWIQALCSRSDAERAAFGSCLTALRERALAASINRLSTARYFSAAMASAIGCSSTLPSKDCHANRIFTRSSSSRGPGCPIRSGASLSPMYFGRSKSPISQRNSIPCRSCSTKSSSLNTASITKPQHRSPLSPRSGMAGLQTSPAFTYILPPIMRNIISEPATPPH